MNRKISKMFSAKAQRIRRWETKEMWTRDHIFTRCKTIRLLILLTQINKESIGYF